MAKQWETILGKVISGVGTVLLCWIAVGLLKRACETTGQTVIVTYVCFVFAAGLFVFICQKFALKTAYQMTGLFLLTFLAQFIVSRNVALVYETDLQFYYDTAVELTKGTFEKPSLYHAVFPGTITYPSFLSLWMKLFGVSRFVPIVLNQIALCGTACVIFLFCRRHMSAPWALAAGFLSCLHPAILFFSNTCNAELLFSALTILAYFFLIKSQDFEDSDKRGIYLTLSAFLCGCSNFFRPLGIVMLVALLIQVVLFHRDAIKTKAFFCFLMIGVYVVCMSVNHMLVTSLTGYDPPAKRYGWNLFVGASELGGWNTDDAGEFDQILSASETPGQVQDYFAKKAFERYQAMGLGSFLKHASDKLSPWYISEYIAAGSEAQQQDSKWISTDARETYGTITAMVDYPVFYLAMIVCIWLLFRGFLGKQHELMPLCFYLVGSFLPLMLLEIAPRYTIQYRMIFSPLAVYGLHAAWHWKRD